MTDGSGNEDHAGPLPPGRESAPRTGGRDGGGAVDDGHVGDVDDGDAVEEARGTSRTSGIEGAGVVDRADFDPDYDPDAPVVCEVCGGIMEYTAACKLVCRNCGYTRDCSDP